MDGDTNVEGAGYGLASAVATGDGTDEPRATGLAFVHAVAAHAVTAATRAAKALRDLILDE